LRGTSSARPALISLIAASAPVGQLKYVSTMRVELVLADRDLERAIHRALTGREIGRQQLVGLLARQPQALGDLEAAGGVGMAEADRQRAADGAAIPLRICGREPSAPCRRRRRGRTPPRAR
jgi:hypothetical protein